MHLLICLTLLSGFVHVIGYCEESMRHSSSEAKRCFMGNCVANNCICQDGWGGKFCDVCIGRVLLNESSGYISDGRWNYSHLSKCSWLIQPSSSHSTLRLRFNEFATECGWDHLYIYDGDSAYSPLIGTFNGLLRTKGHRQSDVQQEIVAKSGKAFLQFYSDVAYNMAGFNISYIVDECENNCFNQGRCLDGACHCLNGKTGETCNLCASNCTSSEDYFQCLDEINTTSSRCSTSSAEGSWSVLEFNATSLAARASTALTTFNGSVWMYGGMNFNAGSSTPLAEFKTNRKTWQVKRNVNLFPAMRYEHTMVTWNQKLLVFGGKFTKDEMTTNEMWEYDFLSSNWSLISYTTDFGPNVTESSQLRLSGHSADIVSFSNGTEIMVVLFGYNPDLQFTRYLYEYNPLTRSWIMPRPSGASVPALFGHTSVYDPESRLIYIHGGHLPTETMTSRTFSYDPRSRVFLSLWSSGRPRYLHSASLMNGVMYVFGGNTHDGTNEGGEDLCYSDNFMAYYTACDRWVILPPPPKTLRRKRYGHQSIILPGVDANSSSGRLLLFSGYDSTMIANMLIYEPASCSAYSANKSACLGTFHLGVLCYWNGTSCLHLTSSDKTLLNQSCPKLTNAEREDLCQSQGKKSCSNSQPYGKDSYCQSFSTCEQCQTAGHDCVWNASRSCVSSGNFSSKHEFKCRKRASCGSATTCGQCKDIHECMWCLQPAKCVPTKSYVIQFPYGQCLQWSKGCPDYNCSDHRTCQACQNYSRCGWCDDGSLTGLGRCMNGSGSGPVEYSRETNNYVVNNANCSSPNWFFVTCPPCQCNGHSTCDDGGNCISCNDNTTGPHCNICQDGFFGNSLNGGNCAPCDCDGKASTCQADTGQCNCFTKGVTGFKCDQCDVSNGYFGNATGNGTCYYTLQENFVFTFKLVPPADLYISEINFQNTPQQQEDVTLNFQSERSCNVRLAYKSRQTESIDGGEVTLDFVENVRMFDYVFHNGDLKFAQGELNSTIRFYVTNITIPCQIKVSLIQKSNFLLTILLILFSTFLVILILTAVLWKLKLMYDSYRHRANRAVQMKEMAARPFAALHLCCDDVYRSTQTLISQSERENETEASNDIPDAFCEEKCLDNQAAVLSVFLWLPSSVPNKDSVATNHESLSAKTSAQKYLTPPPGQSALVIGSVLSKRRNLDSPTRTVTADHASGRSETYRDCRADEIVPRNASDDSSRRAYINEAMQHANV